MSSRQDGISLLFTKLQEAKAIEFLSVWISFFVGVNGIDQGPKTVRAEMAAPLLRRCKVKCKREGKGERFNLTLLTTSNSNQGKPSGTLAAEDERSLRD